MTNGAIGITIYLSVASGGGDEGLTGGLTVALTADRRWAYREFLWGGRGWSKNYMVEALIAPLPGECVHLVLVLGGGRVMRFDSRELILLGLEFLKGNAPLEPLLDCIKEHAGEAYNHGRSGREPYPGDAAAELDREFPLTTEVRPCSAK